VTINPEHIVRQEGDVAIVEIWHYVRDRPRKIVGYHVLDGRGHDSVLHTTLQEAEDEFLRRTWGS
jgi:hypothetical protein